ncbi:Site-specific recombinase [Candidatus Nitrotoga sp. HW29]|uniref:site-specific recombinase n=1 Tax=Candidatus Nitrotoga sp. HW29 TaxID=2886963 RepID=UPI001EF3B70C|nr:site-specific recombinase [Candidatus Nitrotoga sp. HW29]CAH1904047.1 Site-specific recombinase [Candidatus Nitrotoga sp. HW29]
MESVLKKILATPEETGSALLIELVDSIRPKNPNVGEVATVNLHALITLLRTHPEYVVALRRYVLALFEVRRHSHLYADIGILSNEGFFTTVWNRFIFSILPPEIRDDYLKDTFGLVFHKHTDYLWVDQIPDAVWIELLQCIDFDAEPSHPGRAKIQEEMLNAVQMLSYRIASTGLEHELVRNYPDIERFESPFLAQNVEVCDYYRAYHACLSGDSALPDNKHILVLLQQCEEVLVKVRKQALHNGASISLTYHLQRVNQMIKRLQTLLVLLEPNETTIRSLALLRELVREENRKYSVRDVFTRVTDLVALQVTENAGKTGEHYAAATPGEYFSMLRSSMGAGFIVGFMALIKIGIGKMMLAPFTQTFFFSMNYAFGFLLIHIMHFTVATKQPAMTAATIAATVDQNTALNSGKAPLDGVVQLIAIVWRTQMVSILGNVILAIPTGMLIALIGYAAGAPVMSEEKAWHTLEDINPFYSLALIHAAIAGVCLFFAGLISGYYDNKCAYTRIPARLKQLHWLRKLLGEHRLDRFAAYIGDNLGALMGNFTFGIMLGSMGLIGFIFGLPFIDIRHVAFSSANFAFALVALDFRVGWQLVAISLLGIALIGIVNLAVSFCLALYVAMKARQVRFNRSGELFRMLGAHFVSNPREFFFPPKSGVALQNLAP